MKKALLTFGLCLLTTLGFAQENVKKIFGTLTDDFGVLSDVNIAIDGKDTSTVSDENGKYEISATEGDVLIFSRMGLMPLKIAIEDVTRVLNIKMFEKVEKLDGVTVVNSLKSQEELAIEYNT
ncbi:MAG: carboxypeptidase-like regulatory domain-containing protein, partial [Flavobacteriaceae bacterium]